MKRIILVLIMSAGILAAKAQTEDRQSKADALAEIYAKYPDAEKRTPETHARSEESSKKKCFDVPYVDHENNCTGSFEICVHHFLWWDWVTIDDHSDCP